MALREVFGVYALEQIFEETHLKTHFVLGHRIIIFHIQAYMLNVKGIV